MLCDDILMGKRIRMVFIISVYYSDKIYCVFIFDLQYNIQYLVIILFKYTYSCGIKLEKTNIPNT